MLLKFDNFSLHVGNLSLFKDWNFSISFGHDGTCGSLGVMGPSGIGKTSLLRALLSSLEVRNAQLQLDPAKTITAYVPQEPVLFGGLTIAANAKYFSFAGRYQDRFDEAAFKDLSKRLNLDHLFSSRRDAESLSGGERQRLMLLRAMSIRPELIVLDEPCTGMDSSLKEEFLYYLKSLISTYELASIYVSHHWDEMAFLSDTILYLSREGEAKESAKPILTPVGEFCTNPPTISAFRAVFGPQSTLLALNKVSDRRYEGGLNSLSSSDSVYVLGCGPFVTGNPTSKAIREPIRVMHGNCRDRFFRVAFAASAYSALNLAGPTGVVGTIYTNEMASDCVSVQIEMRNGDPWLIANSLL